MSADVRCPSCPSHSTPETEMSYEIVGKHRGQPTYLCPQCGTEFYLSGKGKYRTVPPLVERVTIERNSRAKQAKPKQASEKIPTTEAEVLDLFKAVGWVYPREPAKFEWEPPEPDPEEERLPQWRQNLRHRRNMWKYFRVVNDPADPRPVRPPNTLKQRRSPDSDLRELKPTEPDAI